MGFALVDFFCVLLNLEIVVCTAASYRFEGSYEVSLALHLVFM